MSFPHSNGKLTERNLDTTAAYEMKRQPLEFFHNSRVIRQIKQKLPKNQNAFQIPECVFYGGVTRSDQGREVTRSNQGGGEQV